MTLLNGLHQEVEQSPFVFPVLGVGELGQVGNVKPNWLFIPRTCVHDVSHQQDKFKNFAKFTGPFNLNMPQVATIYQRFLLSHTSSQAAVAETISGLQSCTSSGKWSWSLRDFKRGTSLRMNIHNTKYSNWVYNKFSRYDNWPFKSNPKQSTHLLISARLMANCSASARLL